ncbi:MAG: pyruvate, phosphate dikinase [Bacteroidales bacterium]|nr:pyruvate, phosphate dikinase [Bacteroidales bacterium]
MNENHETVNEILKTAYSKSDVLYKLMSFRVKKILLVAHLYDALSIEREGRLDDAVRGDYYKMNLSSAPEIIKSLSYRDALKKLKNSDFDLVIIMAGIDKRTPLKIADKIKIIYPELPVYLLVNNNTDISYYKKNYDKLSGIENIFVWNGDSNIFLSIVKLYEDKVNVKNDTKIGLSRIILLVEDTERYYSRYIPILYKSVMEQTQRIIEDADKSDDLQKLLKMRLRPKILLATNYEEAIRIYKRYKNYILSVISDVKFKKDGTINNKAGFHLINYIKTKTPNIPTAIQSSDKENKFLAETKYKSRFIDKNSNSLLADIMDFIMYNLGFGDFIFRNINGDEVARAVDMDDFYLRLHDISDESLAYHAGKNHFSLWLRARGELHLSELIEPVKIADFKDINELRDHLIQSFFNNKVEKNKGKIISVDDPTVIDDSNIGILASGALGGKGRGLAFISNLIYNFNINQYIPGIKLTTPKTFIIGTDEYDEFIKKNNLFEKAVKETDKNKLFKMFSKNNLSPILIRRLLKILELMNKPLAVRSSGLFEDSLLQPFAGVFSTYLLPNNHSDITHRLKELITAVKLVFASVFSETSKNYINAVNYEIEEEKMAVIIQEVVGNQYDQYYFPQISGTAQSFNYYPFGKIEPENGIVVAAVGLGIYVVEGKKAYRFSPKHPTLQNNSEKDLYKNTQTEFYAVDLSKEKIDFKKGETAGLIRLSISDAERINKDRMKHCLSVYNPDDNAIYPGIDANGPRIVNFANILKYNYIPLAESVSTILYIMKETMGTPVEIEFAVDLNLDKNKEASLYLLQVKPLIGNSQNYNINLKKSNIKNAVLFSENAMGNGKIKAVKDVIFVSPETFDKSKTEQIAREIAELNKKMTEQNKSYVLIGPGRWGTRDKWIGIPVNWTQISKAKVIVETSLEDFPLEASAGSHFFYNVTSMNVAYLSVNHKSANCLIKWDILNNQSLKEETKFVKHIEFKKPLKIQIDGKKRIAVIEEGK